MKLTVIGCAGSYAGPDSPPSSYLLQERDEAGRTWNVLLDLGPGSLGTLQRVIDPGELDAVVISHLHPDHYLDVPGLEVYRTYHPEKQMPPLPVYAPQGMRELLTTICYHDEAGIPPGASEPSLQVNAVSHGDVFNVGPLSFTMFRVDHPVETHAIRVGRAGREEAGAYLTFSGDTDACANLTEAARGASIFLSEASYLEGRDDHLRGVHLTGKRAGITAREAGVGTLVLTHIPAWTDSEQTLADARAEFPRSVLATTLATYEVAYPGEGTDND
ncbi:MBL fold metallo-hydrolase [Dermabacteraceae bacterium CCM 9519]